MQAHWVIREGNSELIVFVLGWAADHRVIGHILPQSCDIVALYDYRDIMDGTADILKAAHAYRTRYLFAWSFGVWVAEQIFADTGFDRAIALNGTPFPVHNEYGIDPRRMEITIRGLEKGGMEPFDRRAYGVYFESLSDILSPRPLEENISELRILAASSSRPYTPSIEWDKAIAGEYDEIFPPENMLRYWGPRAESLPLPHYPFADTEIITREFGKR